MGMDMGIYLGGHHAVEGKGLTWNEAKNQWEWEGSLKDLVAHVGRADARLGAVVDKKSGAKVSINISGADGAEEDDELFYVESPDGENMYDAYNQKEAVEMLQRARNGSKYIDIDEAPVAAPASKQSHKKTSKRKTLRKGNPSPGTSMRRVR